MFGEPLSCKNFPIQEVLPRSRTRPEGFIAFIFLMQSSIYHSNMRLSILTKQRRCDCRAQSIVVRKRIVSVEAGRAQTVEDVIDRGLVVVEPAQVALDEGQARV
jgi:hypothetical protein